MWVYLVAVCCFYVVFFFFALIMCGEATIKMALLLIILYYIYKVLLLFIFWCLMGITKFVMAWVWKQPWRVGCVRDSSGILLFFYFDLDCICNMLKLNC